MTRGPNQSVHDFLNLLDQAVKEFDTWPAEVGQLEYLDEHFGHWSFILRFKGKRTRFAFDARDSILSAERLGRNPGDFSVKAKALADVPLPGGLSASSLSVILAFARKHAT